MKPVRKNVYSIVYAEIGMQIYTQFGLKTMEQARENIARPIRFIIHQSIGETLLLQIRKTLIDQGLKNCSFSKDNFK